MSTASERGRRVSGAPHLSVVDTDRVVGVVSVRDLVRPLLPEAQ